MTEGLLVTKILEWHSDIFVSKVWAHMLSVTDVTPITILSPYYYFAYSRYYQHKLGTVTSLVITINRAYAGIGIGFVCYLSHWSVCVSGVLWKNS